MFAMSRQTLLSQRAICAVTTTVNPSLHSDSTNLDWFGFFERPCLVGNDIRLFPRGDEIGFVNLTLGYCVLNRTIVTRAPAELRLRGRLDLQAVAG